jgi:hypothetical protein
MKSSRPSLPVRIKDDSTVFACWDKQVALGWTARDLFGLPDMPDRPAPNYQRLARYDQTGLVWLLQGRRVVALTKNTAAIETATGTISYYRLRGQACGAPR